MKLKAALTGAVAASTLVIAGCGSASNLSTGASLTRTNFANSLFSSANGAKSVHIEGTFSAAGTAVTMSGDESMTGSSVDDLTMGLTMKLGAQGSMQMRLVSGTLYMNLASMGVPGMPASKPWVKMSLDDKTNPLGKLFSSLQSSFGSESFKKSFASIATFKKVGAATVRGVDTTHYVVSVNTAGLTGAMGLPSSMTSQVHLPKTVTYNMWVDSQARPVEMSMTLPSGSVHLYFSKWGEPLHVIAPPAAQVTDISSLGQGVSGLSGS